MRVGVNSPFSALRAHDSEYNACRHSLDEAIPFKCCLTVRLVPIILRDQPAFFN